MSARLVEIDQMKKNFISHVSHELKAPLASMQETTHLILERIPGPLTDALSRPISGDARGRAGSDAGQSHVHWFGSD